MQRYQPFYCEENVYWLVQDERLVEGAPHAVFITSTAGRCWLMEQRASPPGVPTWWDYHVVAVAHGQVWDLDSRLGMPVPAGVYVDATFPLHDPRLAFRVVPAAELLATFTTDRSHMRLVDGTYAQPPPAWSPPAARGVEMNLQRFVDPRDDVCGRVLDKASFRRWLGR